MDYEFTNNRHPALDFPLHDAGDRYAMQVESDEKEAERVPQFDRYMEADERKRGERRIEREGRRVFV